MAADGKDGARSAVVSEMIMNSLRKKLTAASEPELIALASRLQMGLDNKPRSEQVGKFHAPARTGATVPEARMKI